MNKRVLAVSAACALGALTLSACGGGSGSANGEVTLKLVAADYGDNGSNSPSPYWKDVAKRFTATNPKIKVVVQVIDWNDIDAQVKTMIQSDDMPDILQTGGYADKVADNLMYKAQEVLSGKTQGNLIPSFAKAGEVKGVQYGIPFVSSTRALFYNKALFKQAGIDRAPQTWDELKADAQKIKAKVPGVTPYALPLGPEEAQGESLIWELGNGGPKGR
ncbi:ABC transporter substrate-binding protein [Streptomyces sp. NBC_00996]|uniref:ABC transporter substrate-binding protein n=1 Tax=Streptomyces sp. NBC_00996 TaxID=2903710 RepID=UPI003868D977|nr:extracellular solute-binding protein [Streptomyces sp. NBC_00996]